MPIALYTLHISNNWRFLLVSGVCNNSNSYANIMYSPIGRGLAGVRRYFFLSPDLLLWKCKKKEKKVHQAFCFYQYSHRVTSSLHVQKCMKMSIWALQNCWCLLRFMFYPCPFSGKYNYKLFLIWSLSKEPFILFCFLMSI